MFFSPTKYKALSGKADREISTFYTNARGFWDDALNAPRSWRWHSFLLYLPPSYLLLGDSAQICVTDTNGRVSHAGLHLLGLYCFTGGWRIARGSNESLSAPQLESGTVMVPFLNSTYSSGRIIWVGTKRPLEKNSSDVLSQACMACGQCLGTRTYLDITKRRLFPSH